MAVPRPLLLALLGTVLLAVTFVATLSSRNEASQKTASPALEQQPAATQPQQQPATLTPADAAKAIFAPGNPIDSARFDVRLNAQELGGRRQRDAVRLSGLFQSATAGQIPSFDVKTSEVDHGKATHSHVASTGDRGYLFKGATAYALTPRYVQAMVAFRKAVAGGGAGQAATAPVPQLDPSAWLKDLKGKGTAKVDGVQTTHITATIDAKRAAVDVRRMVKAFGAASQQPVHLPRRLDAKVRRALRTAQLEAWVGTQDRIVRRLSIDVRGVFPREMLDRGDTALWRMGLDADLNQVNHTQHVAAPKKVGASAKRALGKRARTDRGTWTIGTLFLDPPASVTQTVAAMVQTTAQSRAARKPRAVERAVARHKRVVIFFHQARGLDDSVTDDAVAALRRRSSALVFQDSVANVASYGQVVMSVGVTRAPSIVIIGKSGRARLIEGYIDPGALAQEVADTR